MIPGFRIVPPNCTDFQKSVSQRVLKIITREKVRWKAENTYFSTKYMLVNNCWPMLTNSRKRQKMWVYEIISNVKMVLWGYEERLALSCHYRARGAQPICIHSQSCLFVNGCCIAKILMKKIFLWILTHILLWKISKS